MNEPDEEQPIEWPVLPEGVTEAKVTAEFYYFLCPHCGFEGSVPDRGLMPRPSTKAADLCPSCRGGIS